MGKRTGLCQTWLGGQICLEAKARAVSPYDNHMAASMRWGNEACGRVDERSTRRANASARCMWERRVVVLLLGLASTMVFVAQDPREKDLYRAYKTGKRCVWVLIVER